MTSDVSEATRLRRLAWTMRKEWITALQVERQLERRLGSNSKQDGFNRKLHTILIFSMVY